MSSETSNRLLLSLSPGARKQLLAKACFVELPVRMSLYEADETPCYAYFLNAGMASVVTSMKDGSTAEVGIVGKEGLIGGLHVLGPATVSTNSFVQLEGTALRIPLHDLRSVFRSSEEIRDRVLEFYQEQSLMASQIAGCNRLHDAEERLSRWLLMAQDCADSNILNFTQEFLGMMLGSRRTTVTAVAKRLQEAGVIDYTRGHVVVTDRAGLEKAACDCYRITRDLWNQLYRCSKAGAA